MSITVSTDVFCDDCSSWEDGATGSKIRAKAARAIVKEMGWKRYLVNGKWIDLCPVCAAAYESELAQESLQALKRSEGENGTILHEHGAV